MDGWMVVSSSATVHFTINTLTLQILCGIVHLIRDREMWVAPWLAVLPVQQSRVRILPPTVQYTINLREEVIYTCTMYIHK